MGDGDRPKLQLCCETTGIIPSSRVKIRRERQLKLVSDVSRLRLHVEGQLALYPTDVGGVPHTQSSRSRIKRILEGLPRCTQQSQIFNYPDIQVWVIDHPPLSRRLDDRPAEVRLLLKKGEQRLYDAHQLAEEILFTFAEMEGLIRLFRNIRWQVAPVCEVVQALGETTPDWIEPFVKERFFNLRYAELD